MNSRRGFFGQFFSAGAGVLAGRAVLKGQEHQHTPEPATTPKPTQDEHAGHNVSTTPTPDASGPAVLFEAPDLPKLPYRLVDGVKEFHLMAEPVKTNFLPNKEVNTWGFNGSCPGPTIEVNEGDKVRVMFHNKLPEMTTVHWHGLEVPMAMDGVPGLGQDPVPPGGMFTYEFTVNQNGTYFYHSHFAMQEMLGMIGFFIIHPKIPHTPKVDRDFGIILQEWALLPNNSVPNTLSMEFNWLTLNGKAGPAATPMLVKHGERVRIRFVNLGMDHHPMHLHGNQFVVTGTEGGRIPQSAWYPGNTVLVGVAQARDVEFEAKYIGDWMVHCHLPHHMMNQMVSMVGPMSHAGTGPHTGLGMQEGMGIVRQGNALSEELGPGLGRGLGLAADRERATTPVVRGAAGIVAKPEPAQQQTGHEGHDMSAMSSVDAEKVPGYPQDMWMPMDELVADKPEVYGLPKNWTGAMMGMMTLVRVLPADQYDKIDAMRSQSERRGAGYKVSVRSDPTSPVGRDGATLHVSVIDPSGNMVSDAMVRLTLIMLAMPAMRMAETRNGADLQWNGSDYSGKVDMGMAGAWMVLVEVQRNGQVVAVYRSQLDAK